MKDGPGRGCRAANQRLHLLHRRTLSDEIVERLACPDVPLQQIHLSRELPAVRGGADPHEQLVAKERLLDEVDGAELHRLNRGVHRAEASHDHEDGIDVLLTQRA